LPLRSFILENRTQCIEEDTIDLRELWATLIKRKRLILVVTSLITLLAFVYAFFIAKPVYSGSALIEVGEVIENNVALSSQASKPTFILPLDNVYDLKDIVTTAQGVSASVPKKATRLLNISYQARDKDKIKQKLKNTIDYIMNRHKETVKAYKSPHSKVNMSKVVGEITIGEQPIKPKKKLIIVVAFITGLMLSVFLAFFLEFIQGMKQEEG